MVCRIKNRHTFKSLPILNSAYFTECRFVIRHITQTDTETETEANFTHFQMSTANERTLSYEHTEQQRQQQLHQCKSMVTLPLTLLMGPRSISERQEGRHHVHNAFQWDPIRRCHCRLTLGLFTPLVLLFRAKKI